MLGAPEDEVSSTVFNLLNPDVDLSIKVGYPATLRELRSNLPPRLRSPPKRFPI